MAATVAAAAALTPSLSSSFSATSSSPSPHPSKTLIPLSPPFWASGRSPILLRRGPAAAFRPARPPHCLQKDTPPPTGDDSSSFCIIEGPETVQDFVNMQLQEIKDNIRSRRNKIFLLMEEVRRLRVQQCIKTSEFVDDDTEENEMPDMPSTIPFLPYMTKKTLRQLYLTSFSLISGIIVFGGLIAPSLELKLGLGGTSYEEFIRSLHLPLQLSQVDPIVASFSGGAVGVISALMLVEVSNVEQQAKKRCKYCHGTGYLACARCSSTGLCIQANPVSISGDFGLPLQPPKTQRCPNCSGAGKVMCPTCLCTGMALASEHDPRAEQTMSCTPALLLLLLLLLSPLFVSTATKSEEHDDNPQTYIIHVRTPPPEHKGTHRDWHESFLSNPSRLLHSYSHVLSGFSAKLTPSELQSLRRLDGFVHATPSSIHRLHTTYTPSFLHLNTDPSRFWAQSAKYGEGVIIGILDTGIAPTHPSFDGSGFPSPPSRWRGACSFNVNNTSPCNNKLIGARSFFNETERPLPPIDGNGHGTHTAGTAAGRFVANASVLGSAKGTAAGMAPYAHLAAYKVCWEYESGYGCSTPDVTAAIDTAVADGVDVISISISGPAVPLYEDPVAIAAFSAVKRGVFVAMSAGNDGPLLATVDNISPWMLTVGASTTDRRIRAVVTLGSGTELVGESAYQPSNLPRYLPLVSPQWIGDANASFCTNVTVLRYIGVGGKVVVCKAGINKDIKKGKIVKEAGGAAMIVWGSRTRGYDTYARAHVLPASHVTYVDGLAIFEYISSTANPTATIEFYGTAIGGLSDPAVAAFSSRGPSKVNGGILKPDIIGPGVNILAAWPTPVGSFPPDPPLNMISGTSMSCPHLAGVAALLKSSHPDWSPATIKSAIMTTAEVTNLGRELIIDSYDRLSARFFATGAGHVNPTRANNPGLVYDITTDDYIAYLCGLRYTDNQVRLIASDYTVECANYTWIEEANLNYPSMMAILSTATDYTARVGRTLTNVGSPNSSYIATITRPFGVTMDVQPATLEFTATGEKQSFSVSFGINTTEAVASPPWRGQGSLIWTSSDSLTFVRSPVLVEVIS